MATNTAIGGGSVGPMPSGSGNISVGQMNTGMLANASIYSARLSRDVDPTAAKVAGYIIEQALDTMQSRMTEKVEEARDAAAEEDDDTESPAFREYYGWKSAVDYFNQNFRKEMSAVLSSVNADAVEFQQEKERRRGMYDPYRTYDGRIRSRY